MLREISCNFVDRVLMIRSHPIHEITLSRHRLTEVDLLMKAN
jgi:hypothetical protein